MLAHLKMHSGVKSSTTLEKDAYKDAEVIHAGTFGEKSSTTLEPDHYKDAAWRYDEARRGGT